MDCGGVTVVHGYKFHSRFLSFGGFFFLIISKNRKDVLEEKKKKAQKMTTALEIVH